MLHDPNCQNRLNSPQLNGFATTSPHMSRYCFQAWCYVDRDKCKRDSSQEVFASGYFSSSNDATHNSLFYSYTTCNSSAQDWLDYQDATARLDNDVLGGASLYVTVPAFYQTPYYYKTNNTGGTERGDEYYNDSVPFEGLYMDYMQDLMRISDGDIKNITYTHTSKSSIQRHPSSTFTAAVQDIKNGLVDMSASAFWITGQRLKMTAFTVPLMYDKTVLVIPTPRIDGGILYEASKVMGPFTISLWLVLGVITAISAFLSVWFSDGEKLAKRRYGKSVRVLRKRNQGNKKVYARLALDAFLEKGLFFFSAGVEQDHGASLPHKCLMFGFGFFILISVSAYVANLAAFLTQSGTKSYVKSIQEAIEQGIKICAHPALKEELKHKWPRAQFVWSGYELKGLVDDYDNGECGVLAVGRLDDVLDTPLMRDFCDRGLVFTDSILLETAVGFPIKPELAPGMSYWINQGERYEGVSLRNTMRTYVSQTGGPPCSIDLRELDDQDINDFAQITPYNMILPIVFFLAFAAAAVILQIIDERSSNNTKTGAKGPTTLIGRTSQLDLFLGQPAKRLKKSEKDDIEMWNGRYPTGGGKENIGKVKERRISFNKFSTDNYHEEKVEEEYEEPEPKVKKLVGFSDLPEDDFSDNFGHLPNDNFSDNSGDIPSRSPMSGSSSKGLVGSPVSGSSSRGSMDKNVRTSLKTS